MHQRHVGSDLAGYTGIEPVTSSVPDSRGLVARLCTRSVGWPRLPGFATVWFFAVLGVESQLGNTGPSLLIHGGSLGSKLRAAQVACAAANLTSPGPVSVSVYSILVTVT